MNFKSIGLWICLILVSHISWAETWVALSPTSGRDPQDLDILEEFKKKYPQEILIPAHAGLQNEDLSEAELENIRVLWNEGEKAYFANNFALAETKLTQAEQLLLGFHFRGEIKSILTRIQIRKAQCCQMNAARICGSLWLKAKSLNPSFVLSPKEFPPSALQTWKNINLFQGRKVTLTIKMPSKGSLFLDGNLIHKNIEEVQIQTHSGQHHLAALIPGYSWWVKTLDLSGPQTEQISPTPLVSGTCENPKFLGNPPPRSLKIRALFEDNCTRVYLNEKWTMEGGRVALKTIPSSIPPLENQITQSFKKDSEQKSILKSPWFWIAVGVVAGGVYLVAKNNESPDNGGVKPVHSGD